MVLLQRCSEGNSWFIVLWPWRRGCKASKRIEPLQPLAELEGSGENR